MNINTISRAQCLLFAAVCLAAPAFSATVQSFGASGNGYTDDTAAIQRAVNSTTSGTLTFPSGTYRLTSPVYLKSGVTYQGQGAVLKGNGYFWLMQTSWAPQNVTITGLTFDNGGIYIGGVANNMKIVGNTFQNLTSDNSRGNWTLMAAIFADNGLRNSQISQNTFKNIMTNGSTRPYGTAASIDSSINQGMMIYGLDNTSIDHNTFNYVGEGFHLCFTNPYPSNNVYIGYNTFTGIHRMGMEIQGAIGCGGKKPVINGPNTYNMVIEYNSYSNPADAYWWSYGISVPNSAPYGGYNTIVRNNYIAGAKPSYWPNGFNGYGIEAASANLQVYGNTLVGYWDLAITIDASPNAQIHDNFTCGPAKGAGAGIAQETGPSANAQYYSNTIIANSCPANIPMPF